MAQAQPAIRLGDWLLGQGYLTQTQLQLALREQKRKGTRLQVNLVAAPEGEILQAIGRLYESGRSVEEIVEELLKLGAARLASTTEQDAPMIRLVDRIVFEAVNRGASDIHIQPEEKIVR